MLSSSRMAGNGHTPTFAILVANEPVGMCHLPPADTVQRQADRVIWQAELIQGQAIIIRQQA